LAPPLRAVNGLFLPFLCFSHSPMSVSFTTFPPFSFRLLIIAAVQSVSSCPTLFAIAFSPCFRFFFFLTVFRPPVGRPVLLPRLPPLFLISFCLREPPFFSLFRPIPCSSPSLSPSLVLLTTCPFRVGTGLLLSGQPSPVPPQVVFPLSVFFFPSNLLLTLPSPARTPRHSFFLPSFPFSLFLSPYPPLLFVSSFPSFSRFFFFFFLFCKFPFLVFYYAVCYTPP